MLHEKDGSLSVIRITDKLTYKLVGMPPGYKPMASISGLVALKSGPVTGDHTLRIIAERPSGDRKEVFSFPLKLVGKEQGQNIILNITIGIDEDGLYWFDVVFDDDVLTRIPLIIAKQPEESQKPEA